MRAAGKPNRVATDIIAHRRGRQIETRDQPFNGRRWELSLILVDLGGA
ncbi:MAG: hypothetical protein O6909_11290 [Alphaproteobacteria bacterium]|nr:hypothetical protein [Alphaproteobacteria bacterium]